MEYYKVEEKGNPVKFYKTTCLSSSSFYILKCTIAKEKHMFKKILNNRLQINIWHALYAFQVGEEKEANMLPDLLPIVQFLN
jgi:hypothetical protein